MESEFNKLDKFDVESSRGGLEYGLIGIFGSVKKFFKEAVLLNGVEGMRNHSGSLKATANDLKSKEVQAMLRLTITASTDIHSGLCMPATLSKVKHHSN